MARVKNEKQSHEGEEFVEFSLVKRERDSFDAAAWHASLAGRLKMPPFHAAALDPHLEGFGKRGKRAHQFVADGKQRATLRSAKAADKSLGFVEAVEVVSEAKFIPGTLAVRITTESTRNVDPRTLHLFRWNPKTKRHDLVQACGVNIEGGYAWARITRPGIYSVYGMLTPAALGKIHVTDFQTMSLMMLIIWRIFSPTGPWESLGPNHLSCCILDLAIDPANNDRIYAAASDGGIWRLDSLAGYPEGTWTPLTDQQPSLAINCMAVSPADSSVVYYVDRSGQLYRSPDHGDSWSPAGTTSLGDARRILAHPTDVNTIYVASSTGLWCSNTGGATWRANMGQTTLHDGDMTDAAMDPGDPTILYAAQRSVGLLKSGDSGGTWPTMLAWSAATAPVGTMIKIALGGLGTDTNRTVAVKFDQEIFVNRKGGRGPTRAGGGPWTSLGSYGDSGYGDWCHVIAVDPHNNDVILAGAQQLYRRDGSGSWSLVINYYAPHEDQHRVLFDPTQTGVVYAANDGGVFRSADGGVTWQTSGDDLHLHHDLTLGLVTAQFYTAAVSGDQAVGDAYHQGLLGASSLLARDWAGIEGHAWEWNNAYGDPARPGRFYVFAGPNLFRRIFPNPPSGPALVPIGGFTPTAIAVDARPGSNVLLAGTGTGEVMRAPDGDTDTPTWTAMTGLGSSGGNVVSIAFAPSRRQKAYALTSAGAVLVCADVDSSTSWSPVTSLPVAGTAIAVSVEDDNQLYAIGAGQVFRSITGGGSWDPVPGLAPNTLPPGLDLRSIVAGPGAVYIASASGVFTSPDSGQHWFPYHDGLPNAQIMELLWTENDLFAVTHGRGFWHHGQYNIFSIPPIAHIPDIEWLIHLYIAIHGGDPAPDAIRNKIGRGYPGLVHAGH